MWNNNYDQRTQRIYTVGSTEDYTPLSVDIF